MGHVATSTHFYIDPELGASVLGRHVVGRPVSLLRRGALSRCGVVQLWTQVLCRAAKRQQLRLGEDEFLREILWLVKLLGGLEHGFYDFSIILGMSSSKWLSYVSEGLKPPTGYDIKFFLSSCFMLLSWRPMNTFRLFYVEWKTW